MEPPYFSLKKGKVSFFKKPTTIFPHYFHIFLLYWNNRYLPSTYSLEPRVCYYKLRTLRSLKTANREITNILGEIRTLNYFFHLHFDEIFGYQSKLYINKLRLHQFLETKTTETNNSLRTDANVAY